MAEVPKFSIEVTGDGAVTAPWYTIVTRGASLITDGTALTVPLGTTRTARLHEALLKGTTTALNDYAING
jgi:hypothetical protein